MKRIALINPRYGQQTIGSAEYYARMIAEKLANRYEVEVLTTKAIDPDTWKDWYARNVETLHGVTVRRFSAERERSEDCDSIYAAYQIQLSQGRRSMRQEREWFEKQGPYCPELIRFLRHHRRDYDAFLFVTYANYLTMEGLSEVADRAILIPAAQENGDLQFLSTELLFQRPKAFVFMTDEERIMVRRRFPKTEPIPCDVMGIGIQIPRSPDPAMLRRQYAIDDPYLLYVGTIDEKKDCPMMLRYFQEYKKRCGGHLKLVLMGKAVCRIPRDPDIIHLGVVSDEEKYAGIAGAKALVIPSHNESMSISLLESMALSVPVLVNGACAVSRGHCIKSNGGLYYQNYFEFEGALQYLLTHPVEYMQLCANARGYITQYYDWDRILEKFDHLIRL